MSSGILKMSGNQPALADDFEQRHSMGAVKRAQQIMNEARQENGFAASAEPRHGDPDARRTVKFADCADQPLGDLGDNRRQPACISMCFIVSRRPPLRRKWAHTGGHASARPFPHPKLMLHHAQT